MLTEKQVDALNESLKTIADVFYELDHQKLPIIQSINSAVEDHGVRIEKGLTNIAAHVQERNAGLKELGSQINHGLLAVADAIREHGRNT